MARAAEFVVVVYLLVSSAGAVPAAQKHALRGQTPAKYDDTARVAAARSIEAAQKVTGLAKKGWHYQLPRGASRDDNTNTDKRKRRWKNTNPVATKQAMRTKGMSAQDIEATLREDTAAYKRGVAWHKQMEVAVMALKDKGFKGGKKTLPKKVDSHKLAALDNYVAAEIEAQSRSGKKQRAGSVFNQLDTNKDGVLDATDDPAVQALLKKFDLASESVTFDMFKMGVRDARQRAKKALLEAKRRQKASQSKTQSAGFGLPKVMATTAAQVRRVPATTIDRSPKGGPARPASLPRHKLGGTNGDGSRN